MKQKIVLFTAVVVLIAGAGGLLFKLKTGQRLGAPGVATTPIAGSKRLRVELPEKVLDYKSEWVEVDDLTMKTLPQDTSFGARRYLAPDGFQALAQVVLMGSDRTSLHKPQFCLTGQGWNIDPQGTLETKVRVDRPAPYDLPVVRLLSTRQFDNHGQAVTRRGIYVYWYVADGAVSASTSGFERMWWMARDMVMTGTLQRWAYVSFFAVCAPGDENATFERMKELIAAAAPEFQLAKPPTLAQAKK